MRYEGMVYRPPSEARSLIIQVTIGCAHNTCTFCSMYKEKNFRVRSLEEIFQDLDDACQVYGNQIRRIFLADGDALVLETEKLLQILAYIQKKFPYAERVTSYGTAQDILRKSVEELRQLREAGLEMIYMGAESGDEEILKAIRKDVSCAEMTEAAAKLKESGIALSVTFISGLGGRARRDEHARASARLVSAMNPEYVGFLTLMLEEPAPILQEIRSGKLELLRPEDVLEEMRIFLQHVDSQGTVFRSNHASNYIVLKGTLNEDIPEMLAYLDEVERRQNYRPESSRLL